MGWDPLRRRARAGTSTSTLARDECTPGIESDILRALEPVLERFGDLGISCQIGGSVASSVYGVARSTIDVDILADLRAEDVDAWVDGSRASSLAEMAYDIFDSLPKAKWYLDRQWTSHPRGGDDNVYSRFTDVNWQST